MATLPDEAKFLDDVKHHKMHILQDDGLYRHVKFQVNTSNIMRFDITTWPGFLCISGDMGCYVFSRTLDMFEFFRVGAMGDIRIDLGYWSEKVEAVDRSCGIKEYSEEKFCARINEWLEDYFEDTEGGPPQDYRDAVEREVLSMAGEGHHEAVRAAMEFDYKGFTFQDFWEVNVEEYTYRFVWCCYAIVWAIRQYDREKACQSARRKHECPPAIS